MDSAKWNYCQRRQKVLWLWFKYLWCKFPFSDSVINHFLPTIYIVHMFWDKIGYHALSKHFVFSIVFFSYVRVQSLMRNLHHQQLHMDHTDLPTFPNLAKKSLLFWLFPACPLQCIYFFWKKENLNFKCKSSVYYCSLGTCAGRQCISGTQCK